MDSRQKFSVFLCCLIAAAAAKPPSARYTVDEDHPLGYDRREATSPGAESQYKASPKPPARYTADEGYERREREPPTGVQPPADKQAAGLAALASLATPLIVSFLGPLFNNLSTGLLNGITATINNRTLDFIPIPGVPLAARPSRPYQLFPGSNQL